MSVGLLEAAAAARTVSVGEEEVVRSPGAFLTLTTLFLLLLVVQKQWGAAREGRRSSEGCRETRAGPVGSFDSKPSLLILPGLAPFLAKVSFL